VAYERRTNLGGNNEPVIAFLTLKNIGGMVCGALVVWMVCGAMGLGGQPLSAGWWLRVLFVGVAAIAGIVLTLSFSGISWLDRIVLALGYLLRKPTGGTIVIPPMAVPVLRDDRRGLALFREGEVIARPYRPGESADG
jgi:hypothetical protein